MADFKNSFKLAIDASIRVDKARQEIREIFAALNEQLAEVSNGAATISVVDTSESVVDDSLPEFARLTASFLSGGKRRSYSAIVVKHRVAANFSREVARWRQDANGYPCWIIAKGKEIACGDKISLEQELAELMSTPAVGSAIRTAMAQSVPTPLVTATPTVAAPGDATQAGLAAKELPPEEGNGDDVRPS